MPRRLAAFPSWRAQRREANRKVNSVHVASTRQLNECQCVSCCGVAVQDVDHITGLGSLDRIIGGGSANAQQTLVALSSNSAEIPIHIAELAARGSINVFLEELQNVSPAVNMM